MSGRTKKWARLRAFAQGTYITDPSFSLGYRDPEDGIARDLLWAQMIRRQRAGKAELS